jgi:hypothetical protein
VEEGGDELGVEEVSEGQVAEDGFEKFWRREDVLA